MQRARASRPRSDTSLTLSKNPDLAPWMLSMSGGARGRTRIPVWTRESYRRQGLTDAGILDAFPSYRRASHPGESSLERLKGHSGARDN
jgi:hypothetical protein